MRWYRTLRRDYLVTEGVPWIPFDAIDFLEKNIPRRPRIFEWGSGGSTIFWSRFDAICTSVEHDPAWFAVIKNRLLELSHYAIDYRLIEPKYSTDQVLLDEERAAMPDAFASLAPEWLGYSFEEYVCTIDAYPNLTLDLIFIDGRSRAACIQRAIPKLRVGGYLVLDNSDRKYYTRYTNPRSDEFRAHCFRGIGPASLELTTTTIYERVQSNSHKHK
jgi:hypothetical protein